MRILFIGTVKFSYNAFKTLLEEKANVVGLVTKASSKFNADFEDLSGLAEEYNIPYTFYAKSKFEEYRQFIFDKKPDIIYCFGWSHILTKDIFDFPKYGTVGFHPASLPNNRGRHPIIWALALGLKQTASTFFLMNEGADTGDIISQETVEINEADIADDLYTRIQSTALDQIKSFTKQMSENNGEIEKITQDPNEGNYWRKRGKNDGKLDFRMTSESIYNLVRALTKPYVGAHIELGEKDVIVWKAEKVKFSMPNFEPGKVLKADENGVLVKTSNGAILLTEHEFESLPKVNSYL